MSNHSKNARVLVTDDADEVDGAPDATELVDVLMTLLDHEAKAARGDATRRAKTDEVEPELVLLEVGLHGVDAHDVARELRRRTGKRPAPLEPSSAKHAPDDRSRSHGSRTSRTSRRA